MSLFLLTKSSQGEEKKWALAEGQILGRQSGQIRIDDPKVSRQHAKVTKNSRGQFVLVDLDSKSGFRLKGERVKQAVLTPGLKLTIGNTQIEVIESQEDTFTQVDEPPPIEVPEPEWHEYLADFVAQHEDDIQSRPKKIQPFDPVVELKAFRGLQMDSHWTLGYGPRRAGPDTNDIVLFEEKAPKHCFTIHPTSEGPVFKTAHPDKVLLNESKKTSEVLNDGDIISIGETFIEVIISNGTDR